MSLWRRDTYTLTPTCRICSCNEFNEELLVSIFSFTVIIRSSLDNSGETKKEWWLGWVKCRIQESVLTLFWLQFHSGTCSHHQSSGRVRCCSKSCTTAMLFIRGEEDQFFFFSYSSAYRCGAGLEQRLSLPQRISGVNLFFVCTDHFCSIFFFSFVTVRLKSNVLVRTFDILYSAVTTETLFLFLFVVRWLCKEYYEMMPLFCEPRFPLCSLNTFFCYDT